MQRIIASFLPAIALFAPLAWSGAAQAGIGACGDIHVEAQAECEVKGGIECEGSCTPVSFEAQCAAELSVGCEGECNISAEAMCTANIAADCTAMCEDLTAGSFDCRASCEADCSAGCTGRCEAGAAGGECRASCEATCEGTCSADCEVVPPSADCNASCEASLNASCEAQANIDCQIDCQANGYVDCKANLEGGCKLECDAEQGALFCDGQYVDHGNNLEECIDSLRAVLDIEVEGYAEAECSGNSCEAAAGGSISCAVDEGDDFGRTGALMGAFGLMAAGLVARRRRG